MASAAGDRPADPRRVGVAAFVEDALAVIDHAGLESAVVAGWSIGVNTACELAALHPHRARSTSSSPGRTFSSSSTPTPCTGTC